MSCLTAILLIIGVCSLLSYNCKLLRCSATMCLQPHNPWSQIIKSYSPQHASPAKMLPSLAKDFYLPPQPRHGTSVMLSIFCSVLLCFMGLCKGSRLTRWADLDSLPVGVCAVVGVTSRPLANQGQGHAASSPNQRTPRHPIHGYTGRHHAPHKLATHAVLSHTESNHNTHCQAGVTVALVQNIMALYKAQPLL